MRLNSKTAKPKIHDVYDAIVDVRQRHDLRIEGVYATFDVWVAVGCPSFLDFTPDEALVVNEFMSSNRA